MRGKEAEVSTRTGDIEDDMVGPGGFEPPTSGSLPLIERIDRPGAYVDRC